MNKNEVVRGEGAAQNGNLQHLSYSTAKEIYRKGVDYAVAEKLGKVQKTYGKSVDIGTLAHAMVLGGDPNWVVNPFDSFRTAEARKWRDSVDDKVMIISEDEFEQAGKIADAIKNHPLAKELLDETNHEIELKAQIEKLNFVGYADLISKDRKIIADIKTTAQFDDFRYKVFRNDYDLQASVYRLFGTPETKYYFIVAESIAPYRVQIFGTSKEFFDRGDEKLDKAIREFLEFRKRDGETDLDKINFNIGETDSLLLVEELGDWSI